MRKLFWTLSCAATLMTTSVHADVTVKNDSNLALALSIYNNTALVRDVRLVQLPRGKSTILFSAVSEQIKPESVIVNTEGVVLREQNYNFAMLSPENVAKANVGKIVKTILWDEEKGQNIYDKARVLDVFAGRPILQFGYGIEFDFPGRIVWNTLPDNLQTEPSLSLGVEAIDSGDKKLDLMYLTGGLHWTANYVAEFMGDTELNLKSWVSIHNTSGITYNQAQVQLVAGEANVVPQARTARPMMLMKASNGLNDAISLEATIPEESIGEYHVYSLPEKITIANNQTKQVSLLSKDKIKYTKEYRLNSPLYLNINGGSSDFKRQNTDVFVKLTNNEESHLGEPLPQGIIRFYDHDSKGNMLFMGESHFKQMAVGDDTELRIGRSFDVLASGKVSDFMKIAENTVEAEVSISFMNAKNQPVQVVFDQYIHNNWTILSSNVQGIKTNAHTMRWLVDVPAQGSAILNFRVRLVKTDA